MKKAIVIGGGLSGLTAAAKLAEQGYDVTLLEKNNSVGGRARAFSQKGYTFDMGPSWYMMPEVIEEIFSYLGRKTNQYYTLQELKTKYRVFSDSSKPIDFYSDTQKNLQVLAKIDNSTNAKHNIFKLLKKVDTAYSIAVTKLLNKPYFTIFDFFSFTTLYNGLIFVSLFNPLQSYHSFIKKYIKNPLLQKIFEFHTVFLGGNPYNTPALYSILISADFTQKIWYPMGGIHSLVTALEKICIENGVTIKTNSPVTAVSVNQTTKKISSVIVSQTSASKARVSKRIQKKYQADVVVSTMDYPYFDLNIIPKEYREYTKEYWDTKEYAISSVLVYLGVNKKLSKVTHHNFYFQEKWEEHFNTIANTKQYPQNPCYYVCAPSVTDASVAPKGKENLFVLIPVSTNTKTTGIEKYVDHVLKHIETTTGESFIKNIEFKKIFAQPDFAQSYNAYKGNALGLAHTTLQSVFLRPRMKSKKIKNLYYAGQFTQPGIGVPTVLLSAKYIVEEILQGR